MYTKYNQIPKLLSKNLPVLKMIQILSTLATDDEFYMKLSKHELLATASLRSFLQLQQLKMENAQLKKNHVKN